MNTQLTPGTRIHSWVIQGKAQKAEPTARPRISLRCDLCGAEKSALRQHLLSGTTARCKCQTAKSAEETASDKLYRAEREKARRNQVAWGITKPQLIAALSAPCLVCGAPPSELMGDKLVSRAGLHDPAAGVYPYNVVPLCSTCAQATKSLGVRAFLSKFTTQPKEQP